MEREGIEHDEDTELVFQAREWYSEDRDQGGSKKFHIYCFGSTQEGHSVAINIRGFTPFFYIKVPLSWNKHNVSDFEHWLRKGMGHFEGYASNSSCMGEHSLCVKIVRSNAKEGCVRIQQSEKI